MLNILTDGFTLNKDANNQYSLVRLRVERKTGGTSIHARFEAFDQVYHSFFTLEIMKRQIQGLKNTLDTGAVQSIQLEHAHRRYLMSYLKSLGLLLAGSAMFVGLLLALRSIFQESVNAVIIVIVDGLFVSGSFLGLDLLRKKRLGKKTQFARGLSFRSFENIGKRGYLLPAFKENFS